MAAVLQPLAEGDAPKARKAFDKLLETARRKESRIHRVLDVYLLFVTFTFCGLDLGLTESDLKK